MLITVHTRRTPLYAFHKVYMTSGPLSASSTRKNTERALCTL
jgi:hypothetical protein